MAVVAEPVVERIALDERSWIDVVRGFMPDADAVRGFHRRSGAPLAAVDFSGVNPGFLNDVAAGPDGAVHVTDTGIGISQEDQHQLFREFFRSTNPDALARSGTGLGLAIVERIVQRHSGRIELTSELGRGTTVSVTLPAHADDGVGAPARQYAVAPGRSGYRGATPTDA